MKVSVLCTVFRERWHRTLPSFPPGVVVALRLGSLSRRNASLHAWPPGTLVELHGTSSGTRIDYQANMSLRSILTVGNPLLSLIYQRIGDSATRGIVPALDHALRSTS